MSGPRGHIGSTGAEGAVGPAGRVSNMKDMAKQVQYIDRSIENIYNEMGLYPAAGCPSASVQVRKMRLQLPLPLARPRPSPGTTGSCALGDPFPLCPQFLATFRTYSMSKRSLGMFGNVYL